MICREIVHTCSNYHVARAAVDSIGGEFARVFSESASRRSMSRGAFAACIVREFGDKADADEHQSVTRAAQGSEQPVLTGLRYILERAVREESPPAWMIAATRACA